MLPAQSRLGLTGSVATAPLAGPPAAPLLTVSFALQVAGLPQIFPAPPDSAVLGSGNAGFALIVQMLDQFGDPLNISGASSLALLITWPNGEVQTVAAAFATNGTDGQVQATIAGPLGGGWGLYGVAAQALYAGQILQTYKGQLWYNWSGIE